MSAEGSAEITADNLRRELRKLGEYTDYARVRIRARAREIKQPFAIFRLLPCPAIDTLESRLDPRIIINKVVEDLIQDGYNAHHLGQGMMYVDWKRAFEDVAKRILPSVPDRIAEVESRRKNYEADVRRRFELYELLRKTQTHQALLPPPKPRDRY